MGRFDRLHPSSVKLRKQGKLSYEGSSTAGSLRDYGEPVRTGGRPVRPRLSAALPCRNASPGLGQDLRLARVSLDVCCFRATGKWQNGTADADGRTVAEVQRRASGQA